MHVQSCCFANQTFFFFAVLVAVAVVVAKAPYCRRCAFMISYPWDLLGNSNIGTEREACPVVTIYKIKIKE